MNRRTFIGSLCAVLTAPLWGKKAAEPAKKIVIDRGSIRGILASRGLVVDRIEEIPYEGPQLYSTVRYLRGDGSVLYEKRIPIEVR